MDWRGKKNGELLKLLVEHEFEAFITADKKMRYEQNWRNYTIPVIFLDVPNLKYDTVKQLVPQVLALLAQPGRAGGRRACGAIHCLIYPQIIDEAASQLDFFDYYPRRIARDTDNRLLNFVLAC